MTTQSQTAPPATGVGNTGAEERGELQTERVAEKVHSAVDKVAAKAQVREEQLRASAAQTEAQLRELGAKTQRTAGETVTQVEAYVKANPLTSAGIAFAAGFVLSAILRK